MHENGAFFFIRYPIGNQYRFKTVKKDFLISKTRWAGKFLKWSVIFRASSSHRSYPAFASMGWVVGVSAGNSYAHSMMCIFSVKIKLKLRYRYYIGKKFSPINFIVCQN